MPEPPRSLPFTRLNALCGPITDLPNGYRVSTIPYRDGDVRFETTACPAPDDYGDVWRDRTTDAGAAFAAHAEAVEKFKDAPPKGEEAASVPGRVIQVPSAAAKHCRALPWDGDHDPDGGVW